MKRNRVFVTFYALRIFGTLIFLELHNLLILIVHLRLAALCNLAFSVNGNLKYCNLALCKVYTLLFNLRSNYM